MQLPTLAYEHTTSHKDRVEQLEVVIVRLRSCLLALSDLSPMPRDYENGVDYKKAADEHYARVHAIQVIQTDMGCLLKGIIQQERKTQADRM